MNENEDETRGGKWSISPPSSTRPRQLNASQGGGKFRERGYLISLK